MTPSSAWPPGISGIPKSDRFSIYVRGLSDGYKEIPASERRQADRQIQDVTDRFHPPRRRPQPARKGNSARRPTLRVGLLVKWVYCERRARQAGTSVTNRVRQAEPVECRPADHARIAPAARQAFRARVVATVRQRVIHAQCARPRSMISSLLRVKSGA